MKNKTEGWKLLFIVLAALFPAFMPVMTAKASDIPDSYTLTIHDYALEDMDDAKIQGDGKETTDIPEVAKPLAGVEFTVWQVDPDKESKVTSASEAWQYVLSESKSGTTDENGMVKFDLEKGLYYVAETDNKGSDKVVFCEPFLVSVPMEDPSDSGDLIKDVHVYPKNQSLFIDKFVGEAGDADFDFTDYNAAKYKPVAMNTPFGFSILTSLPANLGTADTESYVVTDELEEYFDYVPDTLKVYAIPTKDTPVANAYLLNEGSHYTSKFNSETNTLTVELTTSGIALLGSRYTENQDRYLLIKYDCMLNSLADCGVRLYGGAEVVYKRNISDTASAYNSESTGLSVMNRNQSFGTTDTSAKLLTTAAAGTSSEAYAKVAVEAAVHTGQVGITKLADGTGQLLADAQFGIAATKADAEEGNFLDTGTTDENGLLSFIGLLYGEPGDSPTENTGNTTYWIAEIEAPDGYKLLEDPVEVSFQYQQDQVNEEYYFAELGVYNVLKDSDHSSATNTGTNKTGSFVKTGDTSMLNLFLGIMLLSIAVIIIVIVYRKKKAK